MASPKKMPPQAHMRTHRSGQPPARLHLHQPGVMQPKTASAGQARKLPAAPPVYRPQPVPKVLQTKKAPAQPALNRNHGRASEAPPARRPPQLIENSAPKTASVAQARREPVAPAVPRPQPPARVLQSATSGLSARAVSGLVPVRGAPAIQPVVRRAIVQPKAAVIQAAKYYPNLHPGAAVPVDRSNIFTLDNFADQYRLHRIHTHSVNVPNMKYNFVRTREGQTLLHNRYRHPSLADGQQVLYAGEIYFNNGRLEWWSNGSGHYQPDADGAEQANLPMDYFYSYQQVIKGEHMRKRG